MPTIFYRLFHPIKALRAERDSLIASRIVMEDALRHSRSVVELLRDERDAARQEALQALRAVADWMAEMKFGQPIFNNRRQTLGVALPDSGTATAPFSVGGGRVRARDLVNQKLAEFYGQYDEASEGRVDNDSPN